MKDDSESYARKHSAAVLLALEHDLSLMEKQIRMLTHMIHRSPVWSGRQQAAPVGEPPKPEFLVVDRQQTDELLKRLEFTVALVKEHVREYLPR
jgi:hypothetical protein